LTPLGELVASLKSDNELLVALAVASEPFARVATHGTPAEFAALVSTLFGVARRRPRRLANVANTAVTSVRFDGEKPTLLRFNDTMHLTAAPVWGAQRRAAGAALVALGERAPEGVTAYGHGEAPLPHADLDTSVGWMAERHAGQRVALRAGRDAHAAYARSLLSPSARVAASDGLTHVVASDRGRTLADFNAGASF
ncbi:MAG: hypothetical protein AAGH15_20765, partial [Myxococcota bacterium]